MVESKTNFFPGAMRRPNPCPIMNAAGRMAPNRWRGMRRTLSASTTSARTCMSGAAIGTSRTIIPISPERNPLGPETGQRRASRGGSWRHHIKVTRCAARSSIPPEFQYADYGFRVACTP